MSCSLLLYITRSRLTDHTWQKPYYLGILVLLQMLPSGPITNTAGYAIGAITTLNSRSADRTRPRAAKSMLFSYSVLFTHRFITQRRSVTFRRSVWKLSPLDHNEVRRVQPFLCLLFKLLLLLLVCVCKLLHDHSTCTPIYLDHQISTITVYH